MNSVHLTGRLVRKPEARVTSGGKKYVEITIAVPRVKKSETKQADFVRCIGWDKTADAIEKWFDKGKGITIEGRLVSGKYTNKDGKTVYTLDVGIDKFEFPISAKDSEGSGEAVQAAPQTNGPAVTNPSQDFVPMESDIEIPFE